MTTMHFECGILLCRRVRDFLAEQKLTHPDLCWHESSGWVSRDFTIVGEQLTIQTVAKSIDRWAKQNGLSE